MLKRIAILFVVGIVIPVLIAIGYSMAAMRGILGHEESPGTISRMARPTGVVAAQEHVQRASTLDVGADSAKQILFGDLHVHTTFSVDAFLTSLPIMQGEGAHPPADACDFARYCSGLDFFSINDHAEGLSPSKWAEIKDSIRQCNEVGGNPSNPDLVAFLGWEWTQMANDPGAHYGHKNVVLLDTAEDRTPARPIASKGMAYTAMRSSRSRVPMFAMAMLDFGERQRYFDMMTMQRGIADTPVCADGVPVRELPVECSEATLTPAGLFEKLDDWGYPSIVIPHGNAWGNTTPARIDWEKQLADGNHDPDRQTLIEVYSGHGNSEAYRPWRHVIQAADGTLHCPDPVAGFMAECHRAGEIIRERCVAAGAQAAECDDRARVARDNYLAAAAVGMMTIPGERAEDWLDSGQCIDCFQPAFRFRPGGSAQNALAVSGMGVPGAEQDAKARFRFGFIASSDNHQARPASGYKEFRNLGMTDGMSAKGVAGLRALLPIDGEVRAESLVIDPTKVPVIPGGDERLASFFYTGGLVAVHSEGRNREAIWSALEQKQVYGTSGPRILLWFDLLNGPDGEPAPMGSEVAMRETPRFRVRAVGSREQIPGCPGYVGGVSGIDGDGALTPERLEALCMGECHNPSETRRLIERIEVVRIRPRLDKSEDVAELVEDVWKSFECVPDEAGCVVEFEDAEFEGDGRDTVYYVRALEEPSGLINGDPLRCERDASGICLETRPCRSRVRGDVFDRAGDLEEPDECIGLARARAWSSPIFVDQG
jgi:hypothetical protein